MYARLYSTLVYPAYHWLRRDGVLEALRDGRRAQWATPEQIRETQRRKLRDLLDYAGSQVPYYQAMFDCLGLDAGDRLAAFDTLPPLTKRLVNEHRAELLCSAAHRHIVHTSTGGSTGEKLHFAYDGTTAARRKATKVVEMEAIGVPLGARTARLWGAQMDASPASGLRGRVHAAITRHLFLSTYRMSNAEFDAYQRRLSAFEPVLLESYPSPLVAFCDRLEARGGLRLASLRAVVCSAETLYDWQRERIESTLGVPVYNRYGLREFGDVAHQFPCDAGLHVFADRVFVEILDEHLRPLPPGEVGEIYVTDLDNRAMPFIRYRTGDLGSWSAREQCACGRGWPLLERVEGRAFDVILGSNGNRVGGTFWTILLRRMPGMESYRVHQPALDELVVSYVPEAGHPELPPSSVEYWIGEIAAACGPRMRVRFERVEAIETPDSGKHRFVTSDVAVRAHRDG